MTELLDKVLAAHGGLERWNRYSTLTAHVSSGGALWAIKQQDGAMADFRTTVDLTRQQLHHTPFTGAGLRSSFAPDRVAVETTAGETVEERTDPRAAFAGHRMMETPWDRLHLAYFTGYAMWTYLTEPFSFTHPGTEVEETKPWQEGDETWRRLKVVFPEGFAAHCRENVYYIDDAGLIRRHDYVSEVLGSDAAAAAHYISGHKEIDGIVVPHTRRVYLVDEQGRPMPEPVVVTIDLDDVHLS